MHKTTPTDRFASLEDYPFRENFTKVDDDLRMHYVDEGEGPVILLLHGEPSWSYLYRKMIPVLVEAGFRCVAPDLIGFGKSDKPNEAQQYTYANHLKWTGTLLQQLSLNEINLFCQDWGGLIGLRLVAAEPARFASICAANTLLPTGQQKPNEAFTNWQQFSQQTPVFPVGNIINMATSTALSDAVVAAYDAPFPDETYKVGARVFPAIVPVESDDPEAINNQAAWKVLKQWKKPFLTLFSDSDPITKGGERLFQKLIPGAAGQPHTIIEKAGHFLQEDKGEEIAEKMAAWLRG
ncbi:MAG: haloalkane dehalogenase [Bacteroidota bacterium]